MYLIDDHYCFACGKNNQSGLKLTFSFSQGKTISEFNLTRNFQGYKEIIHGGIVSTILDEAMIHAAMAEGFSPVTAEMHVRFRKPLRANQYAIVEAQLTRKDKRIVEARAVILDKTSREILAEGNAKMLLLKEYPT
jgi:acyl-coenzyme A thioesterase PaaI-like protein